MYLIITQNKHFLPISSKHCEITIIFTTIIYMCILLYSQAGNCPIIPGMSSKFETELNSTRLLIRNIIIMHHSVLEIVFESVQQ